MTQRKFGWIPDLPDHRDLRFLGAVGSPADFPAKWDLRSHGPTVYNQQNVGSCVGNAVAGAIEFEQIKQRKPIWIPSRLFVYYNGRVLEGTVNEDAGIMIRDGMKAVNKWGVCPESQWAYNVAKFKTKPTNACYTAALKTRVIQYGRVEQNINAMKAVLVAGFPFVFGFSVYESFESDQVASDGMMPMPDSSEGVLGGHAVLAVGYDDSMRRFIVRNSWGPRWGVNGHFFMPYEFIQTNEYCDDFWNVQLI